MLISVYPYGHVSQPAGQEILVGCTAVTLCKYIITDDMWNP